MSICPEGHTSDSSDYCDVCGAPMDAPSAASGATAAPAASSTQSGIECPNCQTENVANALFCEACGYDFTTGTMPRPWVSPFAAATESQDTPPDDPQVDEPAAVEPAEDEPADDEPVEDEAFEAESAEDETPDEAAVEVPAEDETALEESGDEDPVGGDDYRPSDTSGYDSPDADPTVSDDDPADTPAEPEHLSYSAEFLDEETAGDADVASEDSAALFGVSGGYDSPPVKATDEPAFEWVAEVWVDPDWYRQQEPPDPMPSPGLPTIVPLRKKSNLIGRPSRSRNIHPDVDCDSDPGASRRQAQLTTDGRRWWIEDLDSANGTYVAGSLAGLPQDPLAVGERQELDPDDRIYLGAWTRMVIRRATEEEIESLD